jgi:hypothetical protein
MSPRDRASCGRNYKWNEASERLHHGQEESNSGWKLCYMLMKMEVCHCTRIHCGSKMCTHMVQWKRIVLSKRILRGNTLSGHLTPNTNIEVGSFVICLSIFAGLDLLVQEMWSPRASKWQEFQMHWTQQTIRCIILTLYCTKWQPWSLTHCTVWVNFVIWMLNNGLSM